jgi:predicted GNAT family acetyltransferase/DNA-binding transcriptional regulator YhcF (GntR family)
VGRFRVGISSADVLALTRAVVRKGTVAQYLAEDNTALREWDSVEEAAESGRAFLVDPKDTLLVVDLDLDALPFSVTHVLDWLEGHGFGSSVVRVASGRVTDDGEPHEHIWVFVPKGQRQLLRDGLINHAGIPKAHVRAGLKMRPPLSPHRTPGVEPYLIAPEGVAEALERLGPPDVAGELSDYVMGLVIHGDVAGKLRGRSGTLYSIALGMRRKNRGFDEFRAMMLNTSNKGGAKLHEDILPNQGSAAAERELWNTWERAGKHVASTPDFTKETARKRIAEMMRDAALLAPWSGRTGGYDLRILMGLCSIAYRNGHLVQAPSLRTLAVEANAGKPSAVSKGLGRLEAAGWIQGLSPDGTTNRFKLLVDTYPRVIGATSIDCPPIEPMDVALMTHPAFRAVSGLGITPGRAWMMLQVLGPLDRADLTSRLGCSASTARRALDELETVGLAVETADGWEAVGDVDDLDRVAAERGVFEVLERQADVIAAERRRQEEWEAQPAEEKLRRLEARRRRSEDVRSSGSPADESA